jgi:hypothetical protein
LVRKIGGPSVKPYQPEDYWMHLKFPNRTWEADHGESQYRRGLYTWWQRTFLHPSLLAFDAPTREECQPQRVRSNTPLQALVLLNDPTYIEAARKFAERIIAEGGDSPQDRVQFAFREVVARRPSDAETSVLIALYDKHRQQFAAEQDAARSLLTTGFAPAAPSMDAPELAAWTSVARALLNVHETVTRE